MIRRRGRGGREEKREEDEDEWGGGRKWGGGHCCQSQWQHCPLNSKDHRDGPLSQHHLLPFYFGLVNQAPSMLKMECWGEEKAKSVICQKEDFCCFCVVRRTKRILFRWGKGTLGRWQFISLGLCSALGNTKVGAWCPRDSDLSRLPQQRCSDTVKGEQETAPEPETPVHTGEVKVDMPWGKVHTYWDHSLLGSTQRVWILKDAEMKNPFSMILNLRVSTSLGSP